MAGRSSQDGFFSFRTLIGLTVVTMISIVAVLSCVLAISVPCVNNFYNQLPVYPGAELIEQKSSTLNYVGAGDLEMLYRSSDDRAAIEEWYREMVDDSRMNAIRAEVAGEALPVAWNHAYRLSTDTEGTDILLIANCLN